MRRPPLRRYFACSDADGLSTWPTRAVMSKGAGVATSLLDVQVLLRAAPYRPWKLSICAVFFLRFVPKLPPHYWAKAAASLVLIGALATQWARVWAAMAWLAAESGVCSTLQ